MKIISSFLFLLVLISSAFTQQLYQGPESGSVPNGVIMNTDNFVDMYGERLSPYVKKPRNKEQVNLIDNLNNVPPIGPIGSNVIQDPSLTGKDDMSSSDPIILKNYLAFLDPGNYIPPDPYNACGPLHVMGVDNGRFRIWDKNGNLLKSISADAWFSSALSGAGAFDPKVQYDHFNKRWIMVWLDQNDNPQRGYFLVSVSDDSIPLGVWYNWAISSTLNGSTESGTWSDYQGVGFDNQALYITGRQFGFYGGFYGCKIRMINKTQLYANNAGSLGWIDIWDVRNPANLGSTPDNIRPSIIYGTSPEFYLMTVPYSSSTYVLLYKLINPTTTPSMTGHSVPVTAFGNPPLAQQLGGGMGIESGGSAIRNEPKWMNGSIWAVHSVSTNNGYSNISYLKINPSTLAVLEDYSYGADGFYHFYPAISMDQNQNILITYSRSGLNEYIGAFFTSRLNTDPPNTLSGSKPLQIGKAFYQKDFGSGRNRWGDYNGIWLDPADMNNFWILTEYAETPTSTWACQMGNIRLVPFSGARVFTSKDSLVFSTSEIYTISDTLKLTVYSYGSDTLSISNIQNTNAQFLITSNLNFPIRLGYQDSVNVRMVFKPTNSGMIYDSLTISCNDVTNPQKKVYLKGRGFYIAPVNVTTMYAVTGTQENGTVLTINQTTGAGTTLGPSGYSQLLGLSIRPANNMMYATYPGTNSTLLMKVNAAAGDAYQVATIPVYNIRGITFDLNSDLYCAVLDGRIYKFNLSNNDTDYVGNTGISNLYALSVNPLNGQLWGVSVYGGLYKISKTNGSASQVGTITAGLTPALTFDLQGNLFVITGVGTQICNLRSVDTSNANSTLIGSTGKKAVNGIALTSNPNGIEPVSSNIPMKFELYQNYPNPFNPVTRIKFDLPEASYVKLTVYDLLGREVKILLNEKVSAGSYETIFNAVNYASGIYVYHIEAGKYSTSRKMILIK